MTVQSYEEYRAQMPEMNKGAVKRTLDLLQGKWTIKVIYQLSYQGQMRFGDLQRSLAPITNTMLTTTLRELEERGLVQRIQYNEVPPRVEYFLTDAGKMLYPVFSELEKWGREYLPACE